MTQYKFLTWNILDTKFIHLNKNKCVKTTPLPAIENTNEIDRYTRVAEILLSIDSDIMFLQEVGDLFITNQESKFLFS